MPTSSLVRVQHAIQQKQHYVPKRPSSLTNAPGGTHSEVVPASVSNPLVDEASEDHNALASSGGPTVDDGSNGIINDGDDGTPARSQGSKSSKGRTPELDNDGGGGSSKSQSYGGSSGKSSKDRRPEQHAQSNVETGRASVAAEERVRPHRSASTRWERGHPGELSNDEEEGRKGEGGGHNVVILSEDGIQRHHHHHGSTRWEREHPHGEERGDA